MTPNRHCIAVVALMVSALNIGLEQTAQAEDTFAAIAFDQYTGVVGYSYNASTKENALDYAVHYANSPSVKAIMWVRNGYVAIALGRDHGAYGCAWASTAEEAKVLALQEASKYTGNCYIAVCVHSRFGKD